jgi:hypothetical protein
MPYLDSEHRAKVLLAVEAAMTEDQRTEFMRRFLSVNPGWRGAEVADVLDNLQESDSDLGWVEPFMQRHPDLAARPGCGCAIRALIHGGGEVSEWEVRALLNRADEHLAEEVQPSDLP